MSMPLFHFVPTYPSPSPYPQVHSLVSLPLYSRLATKFFMAFFFFFLRFRIHVLAYCICFSLSDLPHSVWQTLTPSTSLQIPPFHFFLCDWGLNMNVFLQLAFFCAFFHLISYYWDSSILIHIIIFHLFSLLYSTQRMCILQFIYYFFYWWTFGCFHFYFDIINDTRSIFVPEFWCT